MQLRQEREKIDRMQERSAIELEEINQQYNNNKDQMVQFLLEQVMEVQLEVPRVVKQKLITKNEDSEESFEI